MQPGVPAGACSSCSASSCWSSSVLLCSTAGIPAHPSSNSPFPCSHAVLTLDLHSQMSSSPCIPPGSSSVMSPILWLWQRIPLCSQNITGQCLFIFIFANYGFRKILCTFPAYFTTVWWHFAQYGASSWESGTDFPPAGQACHSSPPNHVDLAVMRKMQTGQEKQKPAEGRKWITTPAEQEGGTKPRTGCISSWVFPERLLK